MHAHLSSIRKAFERLHGIAMGIVIDNRINDEEVYALSEWLKLQQAFHDMEPFKTVCATINRVLEDGYIDEQEKEEILDMCWMFDDGSLVAEYAKDAIGVLHGVLQGIASDNTIRQSEVMGLKSWLSVHSSYLDYWPVCEVWEMVNRILDDGRVDEDEKQELLDYCENFCERPIEDPVIHDKIYSESYMKSFSPVLKPITDICDRRCEIKFTNSTFCFTGPAASGKRKDLHEIVNDLDGIPKKNVSRSLNYLIIGAQSSPAWAFSTYGRKIEKVMMDRKNGKSNTKIIHENDFLRQAKS